MELKDAILTRRSIRKYKPIPITDEQIHTVLQAGMAAPSGRNLRPYRFIVVRDEKTLDEIKSYCPYAKYNAPNAVLVIGDTARSPHMWGNDCGAATENILLSATDIGLGTVWCAMYPFADRNEPVKKLLGCKDYEEVYSLILIGVPDEEKEARDPYQEERVTVIG